MKLPHFTAETPMFMPVGTQGLQLSDAWKSSQEHHAQVLCPSFRCFYSLLLMHTLGLVPVYVSSKNIDTGPQAESAAMLVAISGQDA